MSDESQTPNVQNPIEMPNAVEHENLLLGGAPTPAHLQQAFNKGYRVFIDLRSPNEEGVDETRATLAKFADAIYVPIPVAGPAGLTRDNVAALDAELDRHAAPVAVFCATGNRVGALFALRAHWHHGATQEEAMALGRSRGMTRLEAKVSEVIRQ